MLTVIIEACDCVGKSTLIGNLHQAITSTYNGKFVRVEERHFTYPPKALSKENQIEHQKDLYTRTVAELTFDAISSNKVFLFDRFMTGELIYGPMYRDYTPTYIHDLETTLDINNTYYITLCASVETITSRFDGEFIKAEHIGKINDEFIKKHIDCRIKRKKLINVDGLTPTEVFDIAYQFIQPGLTRHLINQAIDNQAADNYIISKLQNDAAITHADKLSVTETIVESIARLRNLRAKVTVAESVVGYRAGTAPGRFTYSGTLLDGDGVEHDVMCLPFFLSRYDEKMEDLIAVPQDIDSFAKGEVRIHSSNFQNIAFYA